MFPIVFLRSLLFCCYFILLYNCGLSIGNKRIMLMLCYAATNTASRLQTYSRECVSSIFTARRYVSAVLGVVVCLSVRPSVCLSVTDWYCIKTLVFWHQKSFRNSNGVTPNGDAKCRWGRIKSANFYQ